MRVGVSGTRYGMTGQQRRAFEQVVGELFSVEEEHFFAGGDCQGVDDEATNIVWEMKQAGRRIVLVCHPPEDETLRAFNHHYDEIRAPRTHFARNRQIVAESEAMVIVPLQAEWQESGGTWYTHDHSIKRGRRVILIRPDGTISDIGGVTCSTPSF